MAKNETTKEDPLKTLKENRKQTFEDYLCLISGGSMGYETQARTLATQYNFPQYRIDKAVEEGKKNKHKWETLMVKPEMPRKSPARKQEIRDEYQTIAKMVRECYYESNFKNVKDESAFLLLAMTYLGKDAEGKPSNKLHSLNMRKISGDEIFDTLYRNDQLTHEGKVRIETLWDSYYGVMESFTTKKPKTQFEKPVIIEDIEKRVNSPSEEIKKLSPK